jgi:tetratricopeptide (TPR) repeat protein
MEGEKMKTYLSAAVLSLAFCVPSAVAHSQDRAQAPAPAQSSAGSGPFSQLDPAKRAEAYYDFAMAHLNEELYEVSGSSEYANQAIEFYKKALELDPNAPDITEHLAETYAKSQRIRDAVLEAKSVLKRDPDNVGAHRLLARIYVHTLGELSAATPQKETIALAIDELQAVRRIDPSDMESALWLARLYRFENEHDKAEEVLRGILRSDPENEPALEQLSQLLLDKGRAPEAIALLEQAEEGSLSTGVLDLLGDGYTQTHNYAKAEETFRKAASAEPNEASHIHGLAQALLAENKLAEAAQQYKRLTELEPESAENYLRLSQIYRHLNKLDLAEDSLMHAKQLTPGNLEVLYNEAVLYEAQGRFEDAVRILSDAIAGLKGQSSGAKPNTLAILYEQLGRVYRDSGNYSAAARTFEDMGKLGPQEAKHAQLLLIETYRAGRDLDKAIAIAKTAMSADPGDRELVATYAMLLAEKNQTDDAEKSLRSLLKGTADDREIYLDLAQVEERGRRYPGAEKDVKTAIQMADQPADKEAAQFMLGAIYERQKKYEEAEEQFQKVLATNPQSAAVLNYYGYMLADRGVRLEEAAGMVQRAVQQEPSNGAYLDSLGWVYFKQNKLPEAEEYLQKAVQRSSHDPTILGHLGDVYAKLGRTERAAELYEKAQIEWQHILPADYEPDQVAQLDQKLKTLKRRLAQKSATTDAKPQ